jgi:RNA polymerase sigma-70 factor (ECF subfamily)
MVRTIYWFLNSMQQEAQEIARGLRRRDPDLLERLIQQYHYRLLRYLLMLTGNQETAEDLFQETWVRVLEKGHQYNARWKFEAWLFTIARHLVIDLLVRRRQSQSLEALLEPREGEQPMELADPEGTTPFETAAQSEEAQHVASLLRRLPASYREVLVLRFQEDLELSEIASIVRAPLSTIKSRLYRGLEALRQHLEEQAS